MFGRFKIKGRKCTATSEGLGTKPGRNKTYFNPLMMGNIFKICMQKLGLHVLRIYREPPDTEFSFFLNFVII